MASAGRGDRDDSGIDLSLVFPVFNEEASISRMLHAAVAAGEDLVRAGLIRNFEIVVVDDGSTDASGAIVDAAATEDERIDVVHHATNLGFGAAVRTACSESRGKMVLLTDADLPFNLAEAFKAITLLRYYDADIVSAYRFDRTGEGPKRYLYSHVYNSLVRALLRVRVRDVNFAAKLIRREVLDTIDLRSNSPFIDAELLARAERAGFHVVQFGVDYFPRRYGESSTASWTVIRAMLSEMWSMLSELRRSDQSIPPGR